MELQVLHLVDTLLVVEVVEQYLELVDLEDLVVAELVEHMLQHQLLVQVELQALVVEEVEVDFQQVVMVVPAL